jgi:hypothetical protein
MAESYRDMKKSASSKVVQSLPGLGGEVKWDGENAEVIAPR